jgi:hypothetical protein
MQKLPMKKLLIVSSALIATSCLVECRSMAKAAARYWTKKQINEFKHTCTEGVKANKTVGNGSEFCDCASENLMEKYHNYDEAKTLSIEQIIKEQKECITSVNKVNRGTLINTPSKR